MVVMIVVYFVASFIFVAAAVEVEHMIGPCGIGPLFFLLCFITGGVNVIAAAWRRKW